MKKWIASFLVVASLGSVALHAFADECHPERGYRYRTTYREWDRAIYHQYNYNEERCSVTYAGGGEYYTCYEYQPTDYVYVEELHMSNGYTRVNVYRDQGGSYPYATYYVYNGRVERRDFYGHRYYHEVYYSPYYRQSETVWVSLDWNRGFDRVIIGSYTALVGVNILLNSHSDAELAVGGITAILGSMSISSGQQKMQEESELQKRIAEERKHAGEL